MTLYTPPDIDHAYATWKASCGPAAVAALLGRPVMDVRSLFPDFRGWVNPTGVKAALDKAGVTWKGCGATWPPRGLAFIQFEGPWEQRSIYESYRHTHWVSVSSGRVYDVNADGWLTRSEWEGWIVPALLDHNKGSTGWRVRTGIEVTQ